jgi:hypothetical protein
MEQLFFLHFLMHSQPDRRFSQTTHLGCPSQTHRRGSWTISALECLESCQILGSEQLLRREQSMRALPDPSLALSSQASVLSTPAFDAATTVTNSPAAGGGPLGIPGIGVGAPTGSVPGAKRAAASSARWIDPAQSSARLRPRASARPRRSLGAGTWRSALPSLTPIALSRPRASAAARRSKERSRPAEASLLAAAAAAGLPGIPPPPRSGNRSTIKTATTRRKERKKKMKVSSFFFFSSFFKFFLSLA